MSLQSPRFESDLRPRPTRRAGSTASGYAVAVGGTAVVFGALVLLRDLLPNTPPYLPFLLPVLVAAWHAGLRPGVLATILGGISAAIYFSFVLSSDAPLDLERMRMVTTVLFFAIGVTASFVCEALHSAQRRLEAERTRLGESEERFRRMAETVPSMIWTAAPDGRITYTNDRWLQFCGLTSEQNATRWPELVLHPDDHERCVEQWTGALREGTEYEIEVRNRRHDGVFRWFVTRAVPLRDAEGELVSWFGVTTDIHDYKELLQRLREADRRKDEFIATLAHELRNPLAPLLNGVHLLRVAGEDVSTREDSIGVMERQLHHVVRIVDDLLDVGRITQGKIELRRERIELASVIRNAVETAWPVLESRDHEFSLSLPPRPLLVDGDAVRLAQVFTNLLNNAARYTRPGGRIWLAIEPESRSALVKVRDTSSGIPSDMLVSIFDPFTQVDRSFEGAREGLGIGLTIVKRMVEMHGGEVEARSEGEGRGSEFLVRLPLAAPATGAGTVQAESPV